MLLAQKIREGKVDYLGFCHGADSHKDDDLGHQCSTEEWLGASALVYELVAELSSELNRPIPLTLALFGGYRRDRYDAVLALHAADLRVCLKTLCGQAELDPFTLPELP